MVDLWIPLQQEAGVKLWPTTVYPIFLRLCHHLHKINKVVPLYLSYPYFGTQSKIKVIPISDFMVTFNVHFTSHFASPYTFQIEHMCKLCVQHKCSVIFFYVSFLPMQALSCCTGEWRVLVMHDMYTAVDSTCLHSFQNCIYVYCNCCYLKCE